MNMHTFIQVSSLKTNVAQIGEKLASLIGMVQPSLVRIKEEKARLQRNFYLL